MPCQGSGCRYLHLAAGQAAAQVCSGLSHVMSPRSGHNAGVQAPANFILADILDCHSAWPVPTQCGTAKASTRLPPLRQQPHRSSCRP